MKRIELIGVVVFAFLGTAGCGGDNSSGTCTKICTTGKACGDTCIAVTDTCHSAPGSACDAR